LKDNDFLASIWRGFLYTPETSTLTSCSLDRSRQLQNTTPWVSLWFEACQHHAPLACAVAPSSGGAQTHRATGYNAPAAARAAEGATIQHPGWGGNDVGFLPFPVS
jgi:hypothetical protein